MTSNVIHKEQQNVMMMKNITKVINWKKIKNIPI